MTQTWTDPAACDDRADEPSCRGTRPDQSTSAVPDGYKLCAKCGIVKAHNEFGRNRSKSDGLHTQCKACRAAHYAEKRANSPIARWLRGETDDVPTGVEAWLLDRIERDGGDACWAWTGPTNGNGYGQTSFDGVKVYAHHVALRLWSGVVVPEKMHVDHLCRRPLCTNPAHLEVVTPQVNNARSGSPSAENARKTHCDNGHEFTDANTYVYPDGERECRACKRARARAHYARARSGAKLHGSHAWFMERVEQRMFLRTIEFNISERSA